MNLGKSSTLRGRARSIVVRLVLIVLAVAAGAWLKLELDCHWGEVVPGRIYRSSKMPALLVHQKLAQNHIRVILLLTDDPPDSDSQAEQHAAAELGIQILRYPLRGTGVGDPNYYLEALTALCCANQRGEACLIHCHSGTHRTGAMVAIYRVLIQGVSPVQAKRELQRWGWDENNNPQLLPYLNSHMAEWARGLKERGVIDRVPDPIPQFPS